MISGMYSEKLENSADDEKTGVKRLRTGSKYYTAGQRIRGTLLPLPMNIGEWYIKQETDFSLPYDIIFEYDNALIKSDKEAPAFMKIKTSILLSLYFFLTKRRRSENIFSSGKILPGSFNRKNDRTF